MSGELDDVLQALIVEALPGLCGGASPPVRGERRERHARA